LRRGTFVGARAPLPTLVLVGLVVSLVLTGCGADPGDPQVDAAPGPAALEVSVGDGTILLDDTRTGERFEVRLGVPDGKVLHAVLRPGDHAEQTVLALTRVRELDRSPKYELRYLTVSDAGVSELLWLPWRQQIEATAATVLDVPTVPVWAPDGSAVAWIEWAADGTRLRTIDWDDTGLLVAPESDGMFALDEVPPGTQLESWLDGEDGVPILIGRSEHDRFSIRLDPDPAAPVTLIGSDV
jgi:hypothetical protein